MTEQDYQEHNIDRKPSILRVILGYIVAAVQWTARLTWRILQASVGFAFHCLGWCVAFCRAWGVAILKVCFWPVLIPLWLIRRKW